MTRLVYCRLPGPEGLVPPEVQLLHRSGAEKQLSDIFGLAPQSLQTLRGGREALSHAPLRMHSCPETPGFPRVTSAPATPAAVILHLLSDLRCGQATPSAGPGILVAPAGACWAGARNVPPTVTAVAWHPRRARAGQLQPRRGPGSSQPAGPGSSAAGRWSQG